MLKDRALDALKAAAVAQADSAQLRAQLMLRQPAKTDVRLALSFTLKWLLTASFGRVQRQVLAASQHAPPCHGGLDKPRPSCSESSTLTFEEHGSSQFGTRQTLHSVHVFSVDRLVLRRLLGSAAALTSGLATPGSGCRWQPYRNSCKR